ncbi:hypothetical protein FQN51_008717 [Onygenales sp. PD_10]|nr:hypothetical protein FQN51_008717 [Onygenales sp. PD_10]
MGVKEKVSKYVVGSERGQFFGGDDSAKAAGGSNGSSAVHIESVEGVKPTRGQRIKQHYKRWCFLVIIPAIAQRMVDDANLPIHSASIMKPTPESVEYSLTASLKVPPPFAVDLDPITLHLYRVQQSADESYIEIPLPQLHLKGNTTIAIEDQQVSILDMKDWTQFLSEAVHQETFILAAKGSTTAHLGALKAGLTLDKQLNLSGLNGLTGYSIKSARAVLPFQDDGTQLKAQLDIPNHSSVQFELGNVTLNLFSGEYTLGTAIIYDVVLAPGSNIVDADLQVDLKGVLGNLKNILTSQKDSLRKGELAISASGNSTVYNGKNIPYFEEVLNKITLQASVPIIKVLTDTLDAYTGNGKGLKGLTDLLKGDALQDITGLLKELLQGDALKDISGVIGDLLSGVNLKDIVGIVGDLVKNLLKDGGLGDIIGLVGDLLKGDGLKEIMGLLKELLKGDGLQVIMDILGGVLKELLGGDLKDILGGLGDLGGQSK